MKYKITLESIDIADNTALKAMQKKLNQWSTTGHLIKFTTKPCGNLMLFTILLKKQDMNRFIKMMRNCRKNEFYQGGSKKQKYNIVKHWMNVRGFQRSSI